MNKEEIKLSSKIENNGNEISLITIATYNDKEYDLQDLLNNLLNEIQRKDNIINELKKWLEEQHQFIIEIPAFTKEISQEHKVMECCYEDVLDKINELEGDNK